MIAAAAMAAHSPSDAVISMFSKSYQYSGKINKLLLIPPNAVIDKLFKKVKFHLKICTFYLLKLADFDDPDLLSTRVPLKI